MKKQSKPRTSKAQPKLALIGTEVSKLYDAIEQMQKDFVTTKGEKQQLQILRAIDSKMQEFTHERFAPLMKIQLSETKFIFSLKQLKQQVQQIKSAADQSIVSDFLNTMKQQKIMNLEQQTFNIQQLSTYMQELSMDDSTLNLKAITAFNQRLKKQIATDALINLQQCRTYAQDDSQKDAILYFLDQVAQLLMQDQHVFCSQFELIQQAEAINNPILQKFIADINESEKEKILSSHQEGANVLGIAYHLILGRYIDCLSEVQIKLITENTPDTAIKPGIIHVIDTHRRDGLLIRFKLGEIVHQDMLLFQDLSDFNVNFPVTIEQLLQQKAAIFLLVLQRGFLLEGMISLLASPIRNEMLLNVLRLIESAQHCQKLPIAFYANAVRALSYLIYAIPNELVADYSKALFDQADNINDFYEDIKSDCHLRVSLSLALKSPTEIRLLPPGEILFLSCQLVENLLTQLVTDEAKQTPLAAEYVMHRQLAEELVNQTIQLIDNVIDECPDSGLVFRYFNQLIKLLATCETAKISLGPLECCLVLNRFDHINRLNNYTSLFDARLPLDYLLFQCSHLMRHLVVLKKKNTLYLPQDYLMNTWKKVFSFIQGRLFHRVEKRQKETEKKKNEAEETAILDAKNEQKSILEEKPAFDYFSTDELKEILYVFNGIKYCESDINEVWPLLAPILLNNRENISNAQYQTLATYHSLFNNIQVSLQFLEVLSYATQLSLTPLSAILSKYEPQEWRLHEPALSGILIRCFKNSQSGTLQEIITCFNAITIDDKTTTIKLLLHALQLMQPLETLDSQFLNWLQPHLPTIMSSASLLNQFCQLTISSPLKEQLLGECLPTQAPLLQREYLAYAELPKITRQFITDLKLQAATNAGKAPLLNELRSELTAYIERLQRSHRLTPSGKVTQILAVKTIYNDFKLLAFQAQSNAISIKEAAKRMIEALTVFPHTPNGVKTLREIQTFAQEKYHTELTRNRINILDAGKLEQIIWAYKKNFSAENKQEVLYLVQYLNTSSDFNTHRLKITALMALEQYEKALTYIEEIRSHELQLSSLEQLILMESFMQCCMALGRYKHAIEFCQTLFQASHLPLEKALFVKLKLLTVKKLAKCYFYTGQLTEANRIYDILTSAPDARHFSVVIRCDLFYAKAECLIQARQFADALTIINLPLLNNTPAQQALLGLIELKKGNYAKSKAYYQEALRRDPLRADWQSKLNQCGGKILSMTSKKTPFLQAQADIIQSMRNKNYNQALLQLTALQQSFGSSRFICHKTAVCYRALHLYANAINALESFPELQDNISLLKSLARTYAAAKNKAETLRICDLLIEKIPFDLEAYSIARRCCIKLKDPDKAAYYLGQSFSYDVKPPVQSTEDKNNPKHIGSEIIGGQDDQSHALSEHDEMIAADELELEEDEIFWDRETWRKELKEWKDAQGRLFTQYVNDIIVSVPQKPSGYSPEF